MCGIAGLAGTFERREGEGSVRHMVSALERRGPDGEGVESWERAVLGHRRLAIFDLSEAGRQPMLSADGRTGVVFNGAIYNFRALRRELEAAGFRFVSETDTEVLVHGYRAWGIDGLVTRLRGMFAFAVWDEEEQKLFLVRDRLGVKPLVYALSGDGRIAFASTARALRAGGFVDEIDDEAIAEFLEFGYVSDGRVIYRGASKVPAANIIEWSAESGAVKQREYWRPPQVNEQDAPTFEEAVEEVERLFLRAVEMRLYADVPVGALLSGGVDSSLVCWAIKQLGGDITAFTVGTPGDPWDETADARQTARELGIRHRLLELSAADSPGVDELVAAYAEPFACASALGMLRVSRVVAHEATVLLTGDGGDDVFLGYPQHHHLQLAMKTARFAPTALTRAWLTCSARVPHVGPVRRAASFLNYASGGLGAVVCAHDGLPFYARTGMLGERLEGVKLWQREIPWSHASARHVLEEFLEYDRKGRFVGEYLTKVDGATMHYALEARSPFLDQELWEFAASLPFELRLRGGRLKAVLRELARRRVGKRVAEGRKRGFGIPVQRWLAGRWREGVEEAMRDSLAGRAGWIRPRAVRSELEKAARRGWSPNQLWYVFVLESWLRRERAESAEAVRQTQPAERILVSTS